MGKSILTHVDRPGTEYKKKQTKRNESERKRTMQGLGLLTTSRAAVSVGVSGPTPRPSPRAGHRMRAAKTKLVVTRRATQKNQEERNNKEVGVSSSTENENDVWTDTFGKKSQAVATALDDML